VLKVNDLRTRVQFPPPPPNKKGEQRICAVPPFYLVEGAGEAAVSEANTRVHKFGRTAEFECERSEQPEGPAYRKYAGNSRRVHVIVCNAILFLFLYY